MTRLLAGEGVENMKTVITDFCSEMHGFAKREEIVNGGIFILTKLSIN